MVDLLELCQLFLQLGYFGISALDLSLAFSCVPQALAFKGFSFILRLSCKHSKFLI